MITAAQCNDSSKDKTNTMVTSEKQQGRRNPRLTRSLNFSGEKPSTPVLDTINYPIHMKNLSIGVIKLIKLVNASLFPFLFSLLIVRRDM